MTIISIDRREREATPKTPEPGMAATQSEPQKVDRSNVVRCSAWAEPVSVNWDLDPMAA